MTNKEYIEKIMSDKISINAIGGVIGCPEDYGLKNTLRPKVDNKYDTCVHGNCDKCWNLEYVK